MKVKPLLARSRSHGSRVITAGWSRRRFRVGPGLVLDVGSGAFPNSGAHILVDSELEDNRHRHGLPVTIDRPFVVARVEALPFADKSFQFVIASHIAEHVEDPEGLCRELERVGHRGYVETPSPLCDALLHEDYHLWRVRAKKDRLVFTRKGERPRALARPADCFYRVFYAGRSDCSRPTLPLPNGIPGSVLAWLLKAFGAGLARLGVLHTRYHFGPSRPLSCDMRVSKAQRIAFVQHGPESGFMRTDLELLHDNFDVDIVRYPGWPSPHFTIGLLRAVARCSAVYSFFASEHTLLAAALFRLARKRVVIAVGGYDIANLPERSYGLTATRRGWVSRACIRLSSYLVAHSRSALRELLELVPTSEARSCVCPLAVNPSDWLPPEDAERFRCAVTVGYIDANSFTRKGIDRFIAAALCDPQTTYVIVGRIHDSAEPLFPSPLPDNVRLAGFLSHGDLRRLLWSASAYVQLSWHESFGMAVAEAMACGCPPVISDDPALSELGGRWAIVSRRPEDDVAAIRAALDGSVDTLALRNDALERFSLARRRELLHELLRTAACRPERQTKR